MGWGKCSNLINKYAIMLIFNPFKFDYLAMGASKYFGVLTCHV